MDNSGMNFDIKALLTLLLLKQGTSSKDIQTAVKLTAAARLMVAEEYADRNETPAACNITNIRAVRVVDRPSEPHVDTMSSDIKALLMLLLLQNGASSREIQTTLRLSARTRGAAADEESETLEEAVPLVEVSKVLETRAITPKQAVRAERLAPLREFAA
jgi:hypothetical protein